MVRPPFEETSKLTKGPWTKEEDEKLKNYIRKHGHERWRALPKRAGLNRCGKSCRLRWKNYLSPDIKRGDFSVEEQQLIFKLQSEFPKKWSQIASHLPGRTDNDIKNYWNSCMRKKLTPKGVDPIIHHPLSNPNLLTNLLNVLMTHPNWSKMFYPFTNLQLLQNLMQMLNKNAFELNNFPLKNTFDYPQLSENLMPNINSNPFQNVINSLGGLIYPQQVPLKYNNLGTNPESFKTVPSVSNSMTSLESEFQSKLDYLSYNNDYISQTETSLPNLVSIKSSDNVNQVESNLSPIHSPYPVIFEEWVKFWDDEASVLQWPENMP